MNRAPGTPTATLNRNPTYKESMKVYESMAPDRSGAGMHKLHRVAPGGQCGPSGSGSSECRRGGAGFHFIPLITVVVRSHRHIVYNYATASSLTIVYLLTRVLRWIFRQIKHFPTACVGKPRV